MGRKLHSSSNIIGISFIGAIGGGLFLPSEHESIEGITTMSEPLGQSFVFEDHPEV